MPGIYSRRVVTTWTPEQWVAVQAAAQQAGLSAVAYVRSTTLAAVATPADGPPPMPLIVELPSAVLGRAAQPQDPEPPGPPPVPSQPNDTYIARPAVLGVVPPPVADAVTTDAPPQPDPRDHLHRPGKTPAKEWHDHGQRYVQYACADCGALLAPRMR